MPFKYLPVFILLLLMFTGCTQLKPASVKPAESILPITDSVNLPDVIKTLLTKSDAQYFNDNFAGSLATLERAVRINPRHAEVWSRMAQVHLKLGNEEQAIQHAKRSNSVIKNNIQLKAFNNKIISSNFLNKSQEMSN